MTSVIDTYISQFPQETQTLLKEIKILIKKTVPNAQETISYGIPTFDLNKKHLIHFAGFKKHIGLFPAPSAILAFKKELSEYKTSKGTIQFQLNKPIPFELIEKIVKFRINEVK